MTSLFGISMEVERLQHRYSNSALASSTVYARLSNKRLSSLNLSMCYLKQPHNLEQFEIRNIYIF
jgi:hypothetical protein